MVLQLVPEALRHITAADWFSTLVAGAFGAFFGAWGAQAVISRNEAKRAMTVELNSINAALALCFSICNRFLSLKEQHVLPMRNQYLEGQRASKEFLRAARGHRGPQPLEFVFQADLRTISPPKLPTELLERYVFEKISIRGRALITAVTLIGAIDGLDQSIRYRNDLIAEYQNAPPPTHKERAEKYFGLRTADGVIDQRFPSSVEGIYDQTDDCIFFSRILADDLFKYGAMLRKRYAWKFLRRAPQLDKTDWTKAEQRGLMPPTEQYEAWLQGFEKRPTRFGQLAKWVRSWWAA